MGSLLFKNLWEIQGDLYDFTCDVHKCCVYIFLLDVTLEMLITIIALPIKYDSLTLIRVQTVNVRAAWVVTFLLLVLPGLYHPFYFLASLIIR